MAFSSKKQNLDSLYNMFKTEYETSMRNLEMCKEKADHIYELVQRQWDSPADIQACLANYDKGLTDLSQLADKLRKFNIQLELESWQKPNQAPHEKFTYPQSKLLDLDVMHESECVITHIKDVKNKLFYITEIGNNTPQDRLIEGMQYYFENNPRKLDGLPKDGEVFGLHLESYLFRAVKENGNSDKFSNFSAYLIDIGEVVTISEHMEMYVLPDDYKKMPAQSVLCKLEQVNGNNEIDLSEYLSKCLYVKHKFRIVDKDRDMLFLNLYADTNPFRNRILDNEGNTMLNEKPAQQITNPFKRYLCIKTKIDRSQIDISDDSTKTKYISNITIEQSIAINSDSMFNGARSNLNDMEAYQGNLNGSTSTMHSSMNGFDCIRNNNELVKKVDFSNDLDVDYMSQVLNDAFKSRQIMSPPLSNVNGVNTLTDEQRQILYEEPLNTTNAMKAVMGYDPKDDKRICPFYNSSTKSCFKGASCKMEHVEKNKEGWTRDEAPTIVDIANQIVYPKVGEHITIIPTHVINVENFFGQIIREQNHFQPTLKELIYKMNSPENVKSYKILKSMPVIFELVIAKYTDGFWYRGKILNVTDDDTVKVFYVDYGNSNIVSIDDIRVWERRYEYLPFQAIRCKIVGIGEKRNRSLEASEQLRKMLLNLSLKARVVNNIEYLDLQVWDVYNNDVAEELISLKLVDRKETPLLRANQLLPA